MAQEDSFDPRDYLRGDAPPASGVPIIPRGESAAESEPARATGGTATSAICSALGATVRTFRVRRADPELGILEGDVVQFNAEGYPVALTRVLEGQRLAQYRQAFATVREQVKAQGDRI